MKKFETVRDLEKHVTFLSHFHWTPHRERVALDLASGMTIEEVAERNGISRRTVQRWKRHPEFEAEVNRLSLMVGIASRAERLRIAMRVIRKLGEETDKDLLDWLKYAQSETDGIKLDLTALLEAMGPLAPGGQDRIPEIKTGSEGTPGV